MIKRSPIWLCILLMGMSTPVWAWEFNTDGDREGWTTVNKISKVEVKNGVLIATITANSVDPFMPGPVSTYDSNKISGIEFRIRVSTDISTFGGTSMYFFPEAGSHGDFDYKVLIPNEWNIIFIDFYNGPKGTDSPANWEGTINQLRFDFADNVPEDYTVEIDWIRLVDDRISNDNFESGTLDPWKLTGEGTISSFAISADQYFSEYTGVEVTGLGSANYHALEQDIYDGLTIEKDQVVKVVGAAKIPKDSWDSDAVLWFRVREYDGANENLSPPIEVTAFDEWFQWESALTLKFDPANRKALSVQLFSKNPNGKKFYFDDIFVVVSSKVVPVVQNPGWPVNAVKLAGGQKITIDAVVTAAEYSAAQPMVINSQTIKGIKDPYFPQYNHNGTTLVSASKDTPLSDFNATYYFQWDNDNFYAAVSVVDDNYSFVGPDPNGSDTLQFVFAETPAETQTANMYIPTLAPADADGNILAKNDFGGWLLTEAMGSSTYVGKVEPSGNWTVEIKIPWSVLQGDFKTNTFPPKVGSLFGFSVLAIDYDNGVLDWFGTNFSTFPWESVGVERIYFIDSTTSIADWSIF